MDLSKPNTLCVYCGTDLERVKKLEEVEKWSIKLEESLRRCDREGVPIIDPLTLSSLRAVLRSLQKSGGDG